MSESARPNPLVPEEVNLQDFAFMPLDVARLRDSDLASDETPEACWAAVLLWCASWHQVPAASIPNNDAWLAKQCGYASRGRIDSAWKRIKAGALRGWVLCSDDRLYHPVVAEKAIDAWKSKLEQRYRTEKARVIKHNQRHGMSLPVPDFDEWVSIGCPQGQTLPVLKDKNELSSGSPQETASKRQGEGQGQGQGDLKPTSSLRSEVAAPPEKKLQRGTQIADDFEPDETGVALAKELGLLQGELRQFRDYHKAHGSTMKDWQAAWRTWARKAAKYARSPPPSGQSLNRDQLRTAAANTRLSDFVNDDGTRKAPQGHGTDTRIIEANTARVLG